MSESILYEIKKFLNDDTQFTLEITFSDLKSTLHQGFGVVENLSNKRNTFKAFLVKNIFSESVSFFFRDGPKFAFALTVGDSYLSAANESNENKIKDFIVLQPDSITGIELKILNYSLVVYAAINNGRARDLSSYSLSQYYNDPISFVSYDYVLDSDVLTQSSKEVKKQTKVTTVPRIEEKKIPKYKIFIATFLLVSIITSFLREKSNNVSTDAAAPTVIDSTMAIDTTAIMIEEIVWEAHTFKDFSFQLPNNMKLNENLSDDTKKLFLDGTNNIALSINVGNVHSGQENSSIHTLITDPDEFGLNVNSDNRMNFSDFELQSTQFDKLGNSESILVNQTSTQVSGIKNIKMKIMAQFVVTQAYFYSFTFSYPENSESAQETVLKIMASFINNEIIKSEQNESVGNSSTSQNLLRYRISQNQAYFYSRPDINFRRDAYLVLGEFVESSFIEDGFAYVEYKNQQGIVTTGWILLSDLE